MPAFSCKKNSGAFIHYPHYQVSDIDPRCTVSGAQMFQGEDLSLEQRKDLQQEQMRYVATLKECCIPT